MKALILAVPALMMVFLLGCTEQSQITGPASMSNNPTSNIEGTGGSEGLIIEGAAKIDQVVMGPNYVKYHVNGSLDYIAEFDGDVYSLSTVLNVTIEQQTTGDFWTISSEKIFKSVVDFKGKGVVSEDNDFQIGGNKFPLHRLTTQYTIENAAVTVTDIKIANVKVVDGVKAVY